MRGSTKQNFWTRLKRALGFQQTSPAAVIRAELKNDTHTVPAEQRQRGGKKNSGGSGMYKRRNPRSMAGYLGHLRGTRGNAVKARLEFIWAGCREANRIAKLRREDYLERRAARELQNVATA